MGINFKRRVNDGRGSEALQGQRTYQKMHRVRTKERGYGSGNTHLQFTRGGVFDVMTRRRKRKSA